MKLTFLLIGLSVALPPSDPKWLANESDDGIRTMAEHAFEQGVRTRDDAETARYWFRAAARGYDELWRRGHHLPELARNRAHAHRLAGDLPQSIAAYHEGLDAARFDRSLRVGLEEARSAVAYPLDGEMAAACRPRSAATIGTRMSPAEAYLAAGGLWLLVCLAVVRYGMTRVPLWLAVAASGLLGLAVLGGLWWHDARRQAAALGHPLVVVAEDEYLRKGNGPSYPPRLEPRLPRAVEARELARRGGWVQIELAGGIVGWLPETGVIRCEIESGR